MRSTQPPLAVHPVTAKLATLDRNQAWLCRELAKVGAPISATHMSGILNGKKGLTWRYAKVIERLLGIDARALMDWSPEGSTSTSPVDTH